MNKAKWLVAFSFYEKTRVISTTTWQEIVVVLDFGLEKIESLSTLIHKTKILTLCEAIKIIKM